MKTFQKIYALALALIIYPIFSVAQNMIPIETNDNAMVLQVDNQNNLHFIYYGNSYFYPAIASCNHVTDWGKRGFGNRS